MFVCTGNSCRSQMAEGLARKLGKGIIEPYSAGIFPTEVHPSAIKVMKEIGIDISQQKSKAIDIDLLNKMDVVITLCDNAREYCPVTPSQIKTIHWPIDDPVSASGNEKEIINAFRKTRNEIKKRISELIENITSKS